MITQSSIKPIILEPGKKSPEVLEFEATLRRKIIGQDEAVSELVNVYQMVLAGMATPGRPITNLMFLGPTGSGKTRIVEAAAEILFGSPKAFIKVDCAEFQHSHEIAKLLGSPPGYLGHRETPPTLTQETLDQFHSEKLKMGFLLFDEIEKASGALWQLLLGILDKATLTLGDNRKIDLSRTIVFMTSNLGASEMSKFASGGIGFAPRPAAEDAKVLYQKVYRVALEATKRKFSPEFMNRIDKVIVFHALTREQLGQILEIELSEVQKRILAAQPKDMFLVRYSSEAREFLLNEGTDKQYGARHLKRAIERHVVFPISSLMASGQIALGDIVTVDAADGQLIFTKCQPATSRSAPMEGAVEEWTDCDTVARLAASAALKNNSN
jgi:ATP-dependent Clp protease ATP-binding subunit ClpB